jgi:hypothetical protein
MFVLTITICIFILVGCLCLVCLGGKICSLVFGDTYKKTQIATTGISNYVRDLVHKAVSTKNIEPINTLTVKMFEVLPDLDDKNGVEVSFVSYKPQSIPSKWSKPTTINGWLHMHNNSIVTFFIPEEVSTITCAGFGVYDDMNHLLYIMEKSFSLLPGGYRADITKQTLSFKKEFSNALQLKNLVTFFKGY